MNQYIKLWFKFFYLLFRSLGLIVIGLVVLVVYDFPRYILYIIKKYTR